jgi:maltooligosyltrehalose trehalohydrolase
MNNWTLGLGAETRRGGVRFRVWAPEHRKVSVVAEDGGREFLLSRRPGGYFEGAAPGLGAGSLYRYRLDGGNAYPDPCSRFQPQGPHGPSQIIDPASFHWTDRAWPGLSQASQVYYEMHVGAFTPEGTFAAARRRLAYLKQLGVTAIEVMPIHDWPGARNWGYDGVNLYAPARAYGGPDAFKEFVNAAHAAGLGVILDVVYNHFGPDGCYLACFSPAYFARHKTTDWGDALNYDGPRSGPVRHFFIQNACYWISEFHCDGLRLDATQNIYDDSHPHVLAELSQAARRAAGRRSIVLIAENESQDVRCLAPADRGGFGLDGVWNDDFHHSARVALTGFHEAYMADYRGRPQELISAVKSGYLYQGQYYAWQKQKRGTPVAGQPAAAFVHYLQNHDQVANHDGAPRLPRITSDGKMRALTGLLLLAPETPLLFMGQEFGATTPFFFFCDPTPELAPLIWAGRKKFLKQFRSYARPEVQARVPSPARAGTFLRSRLDWRELKRRRAVYDLHRDLLRLRRRDPVIQQQDRRAVSGAVLGEAALALRFEGGPRGTRLLVANYGPRLKLDPCPEPLLAPPAGQKWKRMWSSDERRYGGPGPADPVPAGRWVLPKESAVLYGTASDSR